MQISSIDHLANQMLNRQLTSVELLQQCLSKIASYDTKLNSFTHIDPELAMFQARSADNDFKKGIIRSKLQGIPYGLKDVFEVADQPMECHSRLWKGNQSTQNCRVYERLRDAGAVYVGKLATHELALGGPSHELPYPVAKNPFNIDYFTGASSSGAGSAISAGLVPFAIGTDTSGSIRGPACHCGVVGFKPTLGTVSKSGVFPLSYSMDHCGPIVRNVEDVAPILKCISGFDSADPTMSKDVCAAQSKTSKGSLRDRAIAYPRHLFMQSGVEPSLVTMCDNLVEQMIQSGYTFKELHFDDFDLYNACGRTIMIAEGYNINSEDLEARPTEFGKYTYQRLIQGTQISSNDYLNALRIRAKLTENIKQEVFNNFHLMLFPSSFVGPPLLSEFPTHWPPSKTISWTATIPFNVTGNPAINIPLGLTQTGLPLGIQLVADIAEDYFLLDCAKIFESQISFHTRYKNPFFHNNTLGENK